MLQGINYGIYSTSNYNIYDGIIKGKTDAINGTITDQETNSQLMDENETIGNNIYKTSYLKIME